MVKFKIMYGDNSQKFAVKHTFVTVVKLMTTLEAVEDNTFELTTAAPSGSIANVYFIFVSISSTMNVIHD